MGLVELPMGYYEPPNATTFSIPLSKLTKEN